MLIQMRMLRILHFHKRRPHGISKSGQPSRAREGPDQEQGAAECVTGFIGRVLRCAGQAKRVSSACGLAVRLQIEHPSTSIAARLIPRLALYQVRAARRIAVPCSAPARFACWLASGRGVIFDRFVSMGLTQRYEIKILALRKWPIPKK